MDKKIPAGGLSVNGQICKLVACGVWNVGCLQNASTLKESRALSGDLEAECLSVAWQ